MTRLMTPLLAASLTLSIAGMAQAQGATAPDPHAPGMPHTAPAVPSAPAMPSAGGLAGAASRAAGAVLATPITKAVAVLNATEGNKVTGTLTFTKTAGGVQVAGTIEGLTPGQHGFHVHEFGDCSAKDGTSAGGHFNPTGAPHAAPTEAARHTGDMGNVEAGADGSAKVSYTDTHATLDGATSVLGRGVIVHAKADDMKTQPTGDAGGRVACGVIGVAKP